MQNFAVSSAQSKLSGLLVGTRFVLHICQVYSVPHRGHQVGASAWEQPHPQALVGLASL